MPNKKDDSFKPTAKQIEAVYAAAHDTQVSPLNACKELGIKPGGGAYQRCNGCG